MVPRTGAARISVLGWIYLALILFSIVGQALTRSVHVHAVAIERLSSIATILVGCAACFPPDRTRRSIWPSIALVGLLAFFASVEFIGASTGFPFGRYAYSGKWWPSLALAGGGSYPPMVPFAWLMLVGGSYVFSSGQIKNWAAVPVGAAIATCIDLGMEAVMTGPLGYWKWIDQGPLPGRSPIRNSISWFALALIAGAWIRGWVRCGSKDAATDAGVVLGGQAVLMAYLFWM